MAETHPLPRPIRILLADDHALLRQGLHHLLDAEPDLEVVGQASSGDEATARACVLAPDVVVMDVSMPNGDGIRATARIRSQCPGVRVLGLSRHLDPGYVRRLLNAGASGYVVKRAPAVELVKAIRTVFAGEIYVDAAVGPVPAENRGPSLRGAIKRSELTARETEVLRLIARGRSNRDVGTALRISIKTVEFHKARCAAKLGLRGRADIVRYAITQGWMEE
ncbi:MAG TPA: response regulator transcription factor [Gemmatimonadaceae bacterium]|nr:response regulator transcription factor [Gemmatimonadaceae bacterium]